MDTAFAFIDEVGVGLPSDQPLFGVGLFIIENSFSLNRAIHDIFTGAVSFHHKHKTRFEFKFNAVTSNNLRFYQEIVKVLREEKSWSFAATIIEKDPVTWTSQEYWSAYLQIIDKSLDQISHKYLTIVADYLAKPKLSSIDFSHLNNKRKVANILQLESQGSLLLQIADILLGAIHFDCRRKLLALTKSKEAKITVSQLVTVLLDNAAKENRVQVQKMTAIEWLHAVKNNVSKKR